MTDQLSQLLTKKRRAWLYRVLTAVLPILIAYGVLDGQEAALWLALAGSVLGTGMAALHTPTKTPKANAVLPLKLPNGDLAMSVTFVADPEADPTAHLWERDRDRG